VHPFPLLDGACRAKIASQRSRRETAPSGLLQFAPKQHKPRKMGNRCCCCFKGDTKDDLEETLVASNNTSDAGQEVPSASAMPRKGGSGLRAFVIVKHNEYGLLILEACKKRKGGRHFQLPGGHVDMHELHTYGEEEGSRIAAARELYEETGMDFRDRLYRLSAAELGGLGPEAVKLHQSGRRYFKLDISKGDSVQELSSSEASRAMRLATPLSMETFRLCLSIEHTGFRFEKTVSKAAEQVSLHSGGTSSLALLLMQQADDVPHPT